MGPGLWISQMWGDLTVEGAPNERILQFWGQVEQVERTKSRKELDTEQEWEKVSSGSLLLT